MVTSLNFSLHESVQKRSRELATDRADKGCAVCQSATVPSLESGYKQPIGGLTSLALNVLVSMSWQLRFSAVFRTCSRIQLSDSLKFTVFR